MRRGGLPVEQTGCGEHERACADRTESRSARVCILEFANQQSRRWHSRPPAGNDDGVRPVEEAQRVWRGKTDASGRAQRGPRRRAHAEIVPRRVNAGPSHGKNLSRTGKLERAQVVIGDHGDKMGTHGV